MEFIETPTFTRLILNLLSDEEYRSLQNYLMERPDAGDLIKGGGGIRKVRFGLAGRGKSGGVRVIYYWFKDQHQIYMLLVYAKSTADNLTAEQIATLSALVKGL